MPKKKIPTRSQTPKTAHVVPVWAKQVKAYREEAKKTQAEVEKALKATVNTLSLVENGRREFTPTQRHLFFELVGKPEDTSIPTTVREIVPPAPKKAAEPAKAPKVGKASKAPAVAPVVIPAPDSQGAPAPAVEAQASASPKPDEKATTKRTTKSRASKPSGGAPAKPAPAEHLPIVPAPPTTIPAPSPVKEAVLRDITRILGNPGLSDNQAKRLHGLFTSLAVNALLGE
jgi:DNA-binding XRE family transcriptional regulator